MNNDLMQGLFYSSQDKKLFYIPEYYTHGTGNLNTLIKNLRAGEAIIKKFIPDANVSTDEIRESCRYKHMWYFSADCDECPKQAFALGDDWTMYKWITN